MMLKNDQAEKAEKSLEISAFSLFAAASFSTVHPVSSPRFGRMRRYRTIQMHIEYDSLGVMMRGEWFCGLPGFGGHVCNNLM